MTMGDIAQIVGGGTPDTKVPEYWGEGIAWITPADLSGYLSKSIAKGSRSITSAGLQNSGARVMPAGTVLMSSRAPVGYVAIAAEPLSTNQGFKSFVLRENVIPDYAYWYLKGKRELLLEYASGTTFAEISGRRAGEIPIPVPPIREQRRIVAALEEHLSALDAAVAGLSRARANVARYRAAVLDEAVHAGADALPTGWRWTSLEEVSDVQGGIQKQPKRAPASNHYPFLRVANVHRGRLALNEVHRIELFGAELSRLRLERGDLLIVEGNGSQGEIGRMAVWDGSIENCVHQNHIIRARPRDGVLSEYLAFYWNSPSGARRVQAVASSTSGLHTLSVAKVKGIPVPLPPFEEQRRIVESVGLRLAVADRTLADLDVQRARAARLRQSIFQRAFSGGLVPQDPADAPASIAPERDLTERSSAPASSRPARGRGRTARTGSRRG